MTNPATLLWDFAGTDGLALAQALFGPDAARLAIYQSSEAEFQSVPCALLRLCEGNFRVGVYGQVSLREALQVGAAGRRVWVKPCGLASILLPEERALTVLPQIATVKAPHRLMGLPPEHAVPARLGGSAVLIWRHPIQGVPSVEIQTAPKDRDAVCRTISDLRDKFL